MPFYVYRGVSPVGKFDTEEEAKAVAQPGDVIHNRAVVASHLGFVSNPGVELFPHANED